MKNVHTSPVQVAFIQERHLSYLEFKMKFLLFFRDGRGLFVIFGDNLNVTTDKNLKCIM